jgi:GT2 family glycosyltransferase
MENETYAVIVTYAKRHELCMQSIEACIDQGIGKIILVNNNSEYESTDEYQRIADKNSLIELVTNDRNLGSAGGFKVGMERVLENGSPKFIWLLDDDNVPERNCLKNLIMIWNSFQHTEDSVGPVLYSYRGNLWLNDYLAVTKGVIKKYYKNNFMGFGLIHTIIRKFKVKLSTNCSVNYPVIRTEYGPYGGMLIDINTFKKIGLPNEIFYLYADDIEYSLRLNKLNVNQYLVYQAKINEIDQT